MKNFVWQSILVVLSFLTVFLWELVVPATYTIPFLGVLIILYLIISSRKKGMNLLDSKDSSWSIYILTTVCLLLTFSTGGLNSNLFFLFYFLCFGIAFVFEPPVVFIFALATILIFLPDALSNDVTTNMLRVGSIVLISPLAFFFGYEYRKEEREEERIAQLEKKQVATADDIAKEAIEALKSDEEMNPKTVEKLNEIIEETETLRETQK